MLTLAAARERALQSIARSTGLNPAEVRVIDDATIEKYYGWVFFYNSAGYLDTGNPRLALAGNAPIVVMKGSGEVIPLGTARPVEDYLAALEGKLDDGRTDDAQGPRE
jgi:hypothetical protein